MLGKTDWSWAGSLWPRFFFWEDVMEKFEPFQKVLVRYNEEQKWDVAFYQKSMHVKEHSVIGKQFPVSYVIPYVGNEHLLGTTDDPEPKHEYKWGDKVEVCNLSAWIKAIFLEKNNDEFKTILKNGTVFIVPEHHIRPFKEDK